VAGLAVLLSSCVDAKAELNLARDGSGRLKLRYAVSRMVAATAGLDGAESLVVLPLSRQEADARAAAAPGVSIVAFQSSQNPDSLVVENLELAFQNLASLALFLDPGKRRMALSSGGGSQTLSFRLWDGLGGQKALDPDLDKFVRAAWADWSIALNVSLPQAARSAAGATISKDGRELAYAIAVPALLESPAAVSWEFRW
jgi:hypothetical protein